MNLPKQGNHERLKGGNKRTYLANHVLRNSISTARGRNGAQIGNFQPRLSLLLVVVLAVPVARVVVFEGGDVDDLFHSSTDSPVTESVGFFAALKIQLVISFITVYSSAGLSVI